MLWHSNLKSKYSHLEAGRQSGEDDASRYGRERIVVEVVPSWTQKHLL